AAGIGNISINKRLPVSLCSRHLIQPEQNITAVRKQADFGRMRGRKAPDFIYADHREKAELQRGENGNKNSQRLGKKLSDSGVNCGSIAADD
ncbi:MAG: hypothetical protein LBL90_03490, partial [Prevotellaceae bacterium]|nr:hypothetical protein [Prevotellaceae bacterium]